MHQLNCPRVITAHQANILWHPPPPSPFVVVFYCLWLCRWAAWQALLRFFLLSLYAARPWICNGFSPCHAPLAHLVACSTIAKLKSKNIRCEVCIKPGTQKSLQLMVARGGGERRGIPTILWTIEIEYSKWTAPRLVAHCYNTRSPFCTGALLFLLHTFLGCCFPVMFWADWQL